MDEGIGLNKVVQQFFKDTNDCKIKKFGSGLIHRTFFLQHPEGDFILQKINHQVFKNPRRMMQNIEHVSQHLQQKKYPKAILKIKKTLDGDLLWEMKNGDYWRIFHFIGDTQYFSQATSEQQVWNTGKNFGEFLSYLKDLDVEKIEATIPDFHNPTLRFKNLEKVIQANSFDRVQFAKAEIQKINNWKILNEEINSLSFPKRIVHADPKISNLLFDQNKNVVAVIDWDTIMPGKIIYDFGDLVRTMACEVDEESTDFAQVKISQNYLKTLTESFLENTAAWLEEVEKENLLLGAKVIIYEQAIRFLSDYLDGDKYYNTVYTGQNLNRARNQIALLEDLMKQPHYFDE